MRLNKASALGGAAVLGAAKAWAATSTSCPSGANGICYSWGVPEAAISSGSGSVYFQLSAPTTYTWAALGIGSRMAGSDIFLMYQDGTGNVTLSTRAGRGHVMPQFSDMPGVELLAGSGVQGGKMVANVKCSQCSNLDLSGQSNWIAAWLEGDALDSTSTSASISMHDGETGFTVDLSQASISSDANPFVNPAPGNGGNGGNGGNQSGSGDGNGGSGGAIQESSGGGEDLPRIHGIIMSVVFVLGYPIGAMLQPIIRVWWIHATFQSLVFLLMWAGFGTGYVQSDRDGIFFDQAHTRMGTILVALIALQPVLGWLHHWQYKKIKSRGAYSYIHIWYGRALMTIGVVNGGLGLQLSGASNTYKIAYSVVAAIIGALYILVSLFGSWRRRRDTRREKERL